MILEVAFFMADETTEKAEKPIDTSVKARYWWAVLYQENMVDGWRDNIEELLQLPYAYCEHVADVDGKGEHRKRPRARDYRLRQHDHLQDGDVRF